MSPESAYVYSYFSLFIREALEEKWEEVEQGGVLEAKNKDEAWVLSWFMIFCGYNKIPMTM